MTFCELFCVPAAFIHTGQRAYGAKAPCAYGLGPAAEQGLQLGARQVAQDARRCIFQRAPWWYSCRAGADRLRAHLHVDASWQRESWPKACMNAAFHVIRSTELNLVIVYSRWNKPCSKPF